MSFYVFYLYLLKLTQIKKPKSTCHLIPKLNGQGFYHIYILAVLLWPLASRSPFSLLAFHFLKDKTFIVSILIASTTTSHMTVISNDFSTLFGGADDFPIYFS